MSEEWDKGGQESFDAPINGGEPGARVKKVVFQPLREEEDVVPRGGISPKFYPVQLKISAELGKVSLKVRELVALEEGSVLQLNRVADEKVLILVNETPFAHGEIVVINDRFGVRITSLVDDSAAGKQPGGGQGS